MPSIAPNGMCSAMSGARSCVSADIFLPPFVDETAPAPYASEVLIVEREEAAMKDARYTTLRLGSASRQTGIR